jgi:NMD protein affecting ribosome stability and mRNA decay
MTQPNQPSDLSHKGRHGGRIDRRVQEMDHDPYHPKAKLPEPTRCPDCGAVYHEGRWQWTATPPEGAHETRCPACRRIHDRVPAGRLTLSGDYFQAHRDEILHIVQNVETREKERHPLARIMAVEDADDGVRVTFTDPHLARGAGEAVHHAHQGELDFHYVDEDTALRVSWRR